jgi:hypothetical protein
MSVVISRVLVMELTPVEQALTSFEVALTGLQDAVRAELFRNLDGDLTGLIERVHRTKARVQAVELDLIAEFEDRGIAQPIGAVTTRAWLRHTLRETFAAAGAMTRMADACSSKGPHPEVGQGLADGSLNWDQAQAIVKGLKKLPAPDAPSPPRTASAITSNTGPNTTARPRSRTGRSSAHATTSTSTTTAGPPASTSTGYPK